MTRAHCWPVVNPLSARDLRSFLQGFCPGGLPPTCTGAWECFWSGAGLCISPCWTMLQKYCREQNINTDLQVISGKMLNKSNRISDYLKYAANSNYHHTTHKSRPINLIQWSKGQQYFYPCLFKLCLTKRNNLKIFCHYKWTQNFSQMVVQVDLSIKNLRNSLRTTVRNKLTTLNVLPYMYALHLLQCTDSVLMHLLGFFLAVHVNSFWHEATCVNGSNWKLDEEPIFPL